MGDYHTVYKNPEGTTTEWDDLQVKFGNKEAAPKPQNIPWEPAEEKGGKDALESKGEEELDELEDETEDNRFMEEYRRRRMEELKAAAAQPRFGTVELIKAADFLREVTNASRDVWVVVHLFRDSVAACSLLQRCLDKLARRFTSTKFVRIVSTDCIPNYPDANLPTLLIYSGGQVKETYVGLQPYGGKRCSPEGVGLALCRVGPVLASTGESEESVLQSLRQDLLASIVEKQS